jgi:PAS domain S-box-containing protein
VTVLSRPELNDSPSLFHTLLEGIQGGVLIADTDHRIKYWNTWFEHHTGLRLADHLGRTLEAVFPLMRDRGFDAIYDDVAATRQARFLSPRLHPTVFSVVYGRPRRHNLLLLPVQAADGTISGVITIVYDVTEMLQYEQQMAGRAGRLHALTALTMNLGNTMDLSSLLHEAVALTMDLVHMDGGALFFVSEPGGSLEPATLLDMPVEMAEAACRPPVLSELQRAMTSRHAVLSTVPPDLPGSAVGENQNIWTGLVCVPLTADRRPLGVLLLGTHERRDVTDDDLTLLTTFGQQIGLAIHNARLRDALIRGEQSLRAHLLQSEEELRATNQSLEDAGRETAALATLFFDQTSHLVGLNRVATRLLGASELPGAAHAFVESLRDEFAVAKSVLWLVDAADSRLRLAASVGMTTSHLRIGDMPTWPALDEVWKTGRAKSGVGVDGAVGWNTFFGDWLLLPVKAHNEVLGVLMTEQASLEEDTLRMAVSQAALGLAAARASTQLRAQAATLARLNAELAEATLAKTRFLNHMSHELRTPLNAMIGFAQLLQDQVGGPLTEAQERFVGNVVAGGEHLLQLVNDSLDLAKIEAGKLDLYPERVLPAEFLPTVTAMLAVRAAAKRIILDTDLADSSPAVSADPTRLRQILLNLLTNAIKFTPDGGRVTVRAALRGEHGGAQEVVISVADTGIGIKPEDATRLFGAFEQIDSPLARAQEGTGLGLMVTKYLVELHGGRIWFETAFGIGTTFFVSLPIG